MSEEVATTHNHSNIKTITNKDSINNNSNNSGNNINDNNKNNSDSGKSNGIINEGFTNDILDEETIDNNGTNNYSSTSNSSNNNNNKNKKNKDKNDNNCDIKCNDPPKKQSRIMKAISPPPLVKRPPREPSLKKANSMKRQMSIAKGFMDISLFGANANQLRILISFGDRNDYTFYIIISSLLISLVVQLISGITLIVKEKFDLEDQWSHYLNNVIVIQVFFIVLINVFLSGFGINLMSITELMLIEVKKNQTLFGNETSTIVPVLS